MGLKIFNDIHMCELKFLNISISRKISPFSLLPQLESPSPVLLQELRPPSLLFLPWFVRTSVLEKYSQRTADQIDSDDDI